VSSRKVLPDVTSSRAIGIYALVASLALAYLFIYRPINTLVTTQVAESLNWQVIGAIPLILGFGIIHGIVGRPAVKIFGSPDSPTKAWWVLATVLILTGVLLIWWLTRMFYNFSAT